MRPPLLFLAFLALVAALWAPLLGLKFLADRHPEWRRASGPLLGGYAALWLMGWLMLEGSVLHPLGYCGAAFFGPVAAVCLWLAARAARRLR